VAKAKAPLLSPSTHPASGEMREWGVFQLRYLATKLIHQLDKLARVSIADTANGRPATCKSRSQKTEGTFGFWH